MSIFTGTVVIFFGQGWLSLPSLRKMVYIRLWPCMAKCHKMVQMRDFSYPAVRRCRSRLKSMFAGRSLLRMTACYWSSYYRQHIDAFRFLTHIGRRIQSFSPPDGLAAGDSGLIKFTVVVTTNAFDRRISPKICTRPSRLSYRVGSHSISSAQCEDEIWRQSFLCGRASRVEQFATGSSSRGQFIHSFKRRLIALF